MTEYGGQSTWRNPAASNRPGIADPWTEPGLYDGVLTRRLLAFFVDVTIIVLPVIVATIFIAIFGIVTLGLGWGLFWLISPASTIWAIVYYGASLGGPHAATPGMRLLRIRMIALNGGTPYFLLGASHAVLYWLSVTLLSPFVVVVGLFNGRRRLLHDIVLGTAIINDGPRW